MKTIETQSKT